MASPEERDSTQRFSDRAEAYALHRPGYPAALMDLCGAALGLSADAVVADIGSGTGILSRMLLEAGYRVLALEPNAAMRRIAEGELGSFENFRSLDARAEATGLQPQSVDAVFAAQAFHWFQPAQARSEFARILRPGGFVVLIWNRRRTTGSPFLSGYEELLQRHAIDYTAVDHRKAADPSALAGFFGSPDYRRASYPNEQVLDWEGLQGRLFSSSYVPGKDHPRHASVTVALRRLFEETRQAELVRIEYDTEVYWGSLVTGR
jgi:SAM-dependent methyltransferase